MWWWSGPSNVGQFGLRARRGRPGQAASGLWCPSSRRQSIRHWDSARSTRPTFQAGTQATAQMRLQPFSKILPASSGQCQPEESMSPNPAQTTVETHSLSINKVFSSRAWLLGLALVTTGLTASGVYSFLWQAEEPVRPPDTPTSIAGTKAAMETLRSSERHSTELAMPPTGGEAESLCDQPRNSPTRSRTAACAGLAQSWWWCPQGPSRWDQARRSEIGR